MITVFSTCKPFVGEDEWRQKNAIRSWLKFTQSIILFGKESKHAAKDLGCMYVPDVETKHGKPLISDMFRQAQDIGHGNRFCYLNADNIVTGLDDAFCYVGQKFHHFLLVGKRWDWIRPSEVETFDREWWLSHRKGHLHNEWALEYFGFAGGPLRNLPPFLVGLPGWDNWLVLHALRLKIPVIDATMIVSCIHQEHQSAWRGYKDTPPAKWNLDLAADLLVVGARGSVDAATWVIDPDGRVRPR